MEGNTEGVRGGILKNYPLVPLNNAFEQIFYSAFWNLRTFTVFLMLRWPQKRRPPAPPSVD